jgi:hypothetical protein
MINKIICFFTGHKISTAQCPVTGASLSSCKRCNASNYPQHSQMSFN